MMWHFCMGFLTAWRTACGAPVVVALAGGSGSGKTYLTGMTKDAIGHEHVTMLSHDFYYRDQSHLSPEQQANLNFDHPDMLESSLLMRHIESLKNGENVSAPIYDFATHTRSGSQSIAPAPLILIDGILLLAVPALAEAFDFRVYLDTPADIRLLRRIKRDIADRGRSLENILEQYEKTVRPMHDLFVEPSKIHGDVVVSGSERARMSSLSRVIASLAQPLPQCEGANKIGAAESYKQDLYIRA